MHVHGFGRMGRLALRAAWGWPDLDFAHVNELHGDAATSAHLLTFDSVHGRWPHDARGDGDELAVDGTAIGYSRTARPARCRGTTGVDIVLECSASFRTREALEAYFERGVRKVIVAAPVKQDALNLVVGVNDNLYEPDGTTSSRRPRARRTAWRRWSR